MALSRHTANVCPSDEPFPTAPGDLSRRKTKIDPVLIRQFEAPPIHIHAIRILLQRIAMPPPAKNRILHDRRPPTVISLRAETMGLPHRQVIYKDSRRRIRIIHSLLPPKYQFILFQRQEKTALRGKLDGTVQLLKGNGAQHPPTEIKNIHPRHILNGDL